MNSWLDTTFFAHRHPGHEGLSSLHFDGLLVSNFYNIYYLTGFKTLTKHEREAWVLVTKNNTYILSDGRYDHKLNTQNSKVKTTTEILKLITQEQGLINHLQEIINKEKLQTIGFEGEDLRVNELRQLEEKLPSVNFISTDRLVLRQREIKDGQEIEKISKACQIADQCLGSIVRNIKLGMSEKEIAFKIEFWLKKRGFDPAFSPLVAIDKNSAIPHYDTGSDGSNRVKRGSLILIDFGADYKNYLSDMTRMIFFGKPNDEQLNIYEKLLSAQTKTIAALGRLPGPSQTGKNIDSFCRHLLTAHSSLITNNYTYPHSTGHGVGLEIHEYPKISSTSTSEIKTNQVFTIEPGVYFPGKWGMRIEDTVLVDNNLQPYCLTRFPKSIMVI